MTWFRPVQNRKSINKTQGKMESSTKQHKMQLSFLHIKPTHFKEFLQLIHFPIPPEIKNPSVKINENSNRIQKYKRMQSSLLHIKPIHFNEFGSIWGHFNSPSIFP